MNLENLKRLREVLVQVPEHRFHMEFFTNFGEEIRGADGEGKLKAHDNWREWVEFRKVNQFSPECGTAGCFAGWTALAFAKKEVVVLGLEYKFARDFLELTDVEAERLFYGHWGEGKCEWDDEWDDEEDHTADNCVVDHDLENLTKDDALRELDRLIAIEERKRGMVPSLSQMKRVLVQQDAEPVLTKHEVEV